MFEHLGGGLMRTLISYSDLPMLPPSILSAGGVAGKGLQKKLLKTTQAHAGFGGAHAAGDPRPEIQGSAPGWKSTFSHHLGEMQKAAACWTTLIPIKENNIWICEVFSRENQFFGCF